MYAVWKIMIQIYNCTKSIVEDIFDWSATWSGYEATILEDCDYNSGNYITMWDNTFAEDTIEPQRISGTFVANSALCFGSSSASGINAENINFKKWMSAATITAGEYVLGDANPLKKMPAYF